MGSAFGGSGGCVAVRGFRWAERAVLPVLPPPSAFPYTTRIACEVTASNGSSSMASACAASLALAGAGVPISRHVAGISVGLVTSDLTAAAAATAETSAVGGHGADAGAGDGAEEAAAEEEEEEDNAPLYEDEHGRVMRYEILSDLTGLEDHYGDMDFKVAGSRRGVTALQVMSPRSR